jgi:hypothetical protein
MWKQETVQCSITVQVLLCRLLGASKNCFPGPQGSPTIPKTSTFFYIIVPPLHTNLGQAQDHPFCSARSNKDPCIYIYVCVYVQIYIYILKCMYACMYVRTYACMHVCVYLKMYIHMQIYIYICQLSMYKYIYIYVGKCYIYIYVCVFI